MSNNMNKVFKTCEACGDKFVGKNDRFCSKACQLDAARNTLSAEEVSRLLKRLDQLSAHYEDKLDISAESIMITGDFHIPHASTDMITKMSAIAKRHMERPRKLVVCGDLFDFECLSSFDKVNRGSNLQDDLEYGRIIFEILLKDFDSIYYTMGNHEFRIFRRLDWFLANTDFGRLISKPGQVIMTPYAYINIHSGGKKWRVTHPRNYSRTGKVSVDLAEKFECSIINLHGHQYTQRFTKSGKHLGVDLGCMSEQNEHIYCLQSDTTHPKWKKAFGLLRNGTFYPFVDDAHITDWDFWLNDNNLKIKE